VYFSIFLDHPDKRGPCRPLSRPIITSREQLASLLPKTPHQKRFTATQNRATASKSRAYNQIKTVENKKRHDTVSKKDANERKKPVEEQQKHDNQSKQSDSDSNFCVEKQKKHVEIVFAYNNLS
jgi:hypothetical protein